MPKSAPAPESGPITQRATVQLRLPLHDTGPTLPTCFAGCEGQRAPGDSRCGGPFKQQSSCCNRSLGDRSFPGGGACAWCGDQPKRGIFRGRSEFRGTQFGAKKKRRKKKRHRKARGLESQARRSRCNRAPPHAGPSASPLRLAPGDPGDPSRELAGPQAPRPFWGAGPSWSPPPSGRHSPWPCRRRRRRGAISKRGSPSAARLGRGPGGEGPALPHRRPLAASPGLRAMPPAE